MRYGQLNKSFNLLFEFIQTSDCHVVKVAVGLPITMTITVKRESDDDDADSDSPVGNVVCPRYCTEKHEAWWLVVGDVARNTLLSIKRIALGSSAMKVRRYMMSCIYIRSTVQLNNGYFFS